ncbi:hypothetical protein ABPG72_001304 [Tetrahymena utriculariae]
MNQTNILTYSLNKNEILVDQLKQNFNIDMKTLIFLADSCIQQIIFQDIQNIMQILSQYKFNEVIFEGLDNDISIFMTKELESFFLQSKHISSLSFFAKSNQQFNFQSQIFTSSIDDINIQYDGFFIKKEKNKLKIRVRELDIFGNYLSLLSSLSNNDELNIQVVIVNHSNICGQKKLEIFNILYNMLQRHKNFSISIKKYIEYFNYSKFVCINYKYWDQDQFEDQFLSRFPISKLKINFDQIASQKNNIEQVVLAIKEKFSQLREVFIKCSNQFEFRNLNLSNEFFDKLISYEISDSNTSSIKIDLIENKCSLKQIKDNKIIQHVINYYLKNANSNKTCQILLFNCLFNLSSYKQILHKLVKFDNINVQSSNFSIILNEQEFKLELKLKDFIQLTKILDIIQLQQKQQFYRLNIFSKNFIQLQNENILQLKRKYYFQELKVLFGIELSQNKLVIQDLQDYQVYDNIVNSFLNLEILSVNFTNYYIQKDIFKNLPSTLKYLKISYLGNIELFLDKENFIVKEVEFVFLEKFKTFIRQNKLKNIEIEVQCQYTTKEWIELITQQDQLIKLRIHLLHYSCYTKSNCSIEARQELIKIQENETFLLSILENISIPQIYYTKSDKLMLLQLSYKIRNALMSKLDYRNLDIQIFNAQEFFAVIQNIQSRKELNLPIIQRLSLLFIEEIEVEGLQNVLIQMNDNVKQICIYVSKRCILVFDFENRFYYNLINFNPFITKSLQNLTFFDKIQYESSNSTKLKHIKQMLAPQKTNQSLYLKLILTYEESVQFFEQLTNSKLVLFCDLQLKDLNSTNQVYQILDFLAFQIQNGSIKSLKLYFLSVQIVYSQNNMQYTSFQSSYFPKYDDVHQNLYLEYFLNVKQIALNKLKIILDSHSYKEQNIINQLQKIFSYPYVKYIFLEKYYYEQISNSKVKTLQNYQYHKNILLLFLPKLVKIGLDRYEKIEQFLSFFTIYSNYIQTNNSKLKYNDTQISQFSYYSQAYYQPR